MSLWSTARYDLRLSDAEFYALTPRQFDALVRRHKRRVEHDEYMQAQTTAAILNTGFRAMEKAAKVADYMPSQWGKHPPPDKPIDMTAERRLAIAEAFRAGFGIVHRAPQNG